MEKLPHEKLRKCNSTCDIKRIFNTSTNTLGEIMDYIADEIENNYIPLPCDQEGKPWKIGDTVAPLNATEDSHVTGYIYDGEEWYLQYRWAGRDNERDELVRYCKRPQSKVLDADGVEIKVGDTVWDVKNGSMMEVVELLEDGNISVNVYTEVIGWLNSHWLKPSDVTHKEPDSLEKLRDDMHSKLRTVHISIEDSTVESWTDRLSALIERGA